MDHHSAARPEVSVITHMDLRLNVDLSAKTLNGSVTYAIAPDHGSEIIFDTDGLLVHGVRGEDGKDLAFTLGEEGKLGRALTVQLSGPTPQVTIEYEAGEGAKALQWLAPNQTEGGKEPFLFTQGQAILTRSWIPVQDSPGIRFTYTAELTVPKELMAVMSAQNPQKRSADGVYTFRMDQPIPAYLIALAVGDLDFKAIGPRTGVYAEPGMVDTAAWEFADMERMVSAAEELYGPYRWERYDVLVLPPSFPFGGMENPRLTFATPTILAGDRSLTALIAHELAHSWSGNLVTNATWDDFWLNEGFTVYFEKRICEAVYGKEYEDMLDLLGYQDLLHTVQRLDSTGRGADTHLKLDLKGRDPDDGMTDVAYEKGYAFLRRVEEVVGRARFDAFLRQYFDAFAFQSMTTERFLTYLEDELLGREHPEISFDEWVYGPGIPQDVVPPSSERFAEVDAQIKHWMDGTPAVSLTTAGWGTFEWMHFLRHLPEGLGTERLAELDRAFGFTASGNTEIVAVWLERSIGSRYMDAYPRLDRFLTVVGRRKFLVPLYTALMRTEEGQAMARNIYGRARPNYHSVSVRTLDELLDWKQMSDAVSM
ncbi:MAG: M1 family metallopeptidase [Flavobacteriales bacterium]|nr:M1 family metallopeptidase [Flavobacteriales bacterium]